MSHFITLSSDAGTGVPVTDAQTGDSFSTDLSPPITLDPNKKWVVIPVEAQTWFTSPNISATRANNNFSYTAIAPAPNIGVYPLVIPDGLYAVSDLQATIANLMVGNGHGTLLTPIITFTPLLAEQKIQITISALGYSVDFSILESIRDVIGFAAVVIGPPITVPTSYTGGNLADFSQGVNRHVIHISIVRNSYGADGRSGDGFATLSLSGAIPNRQVVSRNGLSNHTLTVGDQYIAHVVTHLTDQANRRITLNGNAYSITLMIRGKIFSTKPCWSEPVTRIRTLMGITFLVVGLKTFYPGS
jgi:hypothetical protein